MKKLDLSKVPEDLKPDPVFNDLPEDLKDPARFVEIEKKLALIILTSHKHKTATSYVKCEECQAKYKERKEEMKKFGFKSSMQYMQWKRVMIIIVNKANFQVK